MPDKPRVDFHLAQMTAQMPGAAEYWMGIAVFVPSSYVVDSAAAVETIIQIHSQAGGAAANNHAEFGLWGANGGVGRWRMKANANSDTAAYYLPHNLVAAHKNAWTYHVFNFRIDPAGTNAKMKYWLSYGASEAAQTWALQQDTGTAFGTYVPGGTTIDAITPALNFYKGAWRNDGTYTGNKTAAITISIAEFRIGDSSSNYASVHPLGWAQP